MMLGWLLRPARNVASMARSTVPLRNVTLSSCLRSKQTRLSTYLPRLESLATKSLERVRSKDAAGALFTECDCRRVWLCGSPSSSLSMSKPSSRSFSKMDSPCSEMPLLMLSERLKLRVRGGCSEGLRPKRSILEALEKTELRVEMEPRMEPPLRQLFLLPAGRILLPCSSSILIFSISRTMQKPPRPSTRPSVISRSSKCGMRSTRCLALVRRSESAIWSATMSAAVLSSTSMGADCMSVTAFLLS
mmetsp:Transcript_9869/g.27955  ORF Transcript_9869/g.27955 Transcript_9869/m.27955 type:complete len:247 (+) Transcript_9869:976-1716(+)